MTRHSADPGTLSSSRLAGLAGKVGWLATAGIIEYGLQVLLPLILVRQLSVNEFGDYRAVWLLAGTVTAVAPFYLPQVLIYFLPRSDPAQVATRVASTAVMLTILGAGSALLVFALRHQLPDGLAGSLGSSAIVLGFLAAWVPASLLDTLAIAQGRTRLQAALTTAVAVARTIIIGGLALVYQDLGAVLAGVLVVALLKVFALVLVSTDVFAWWKASLPVVRSHLAYALPFALGNAFFLLRIQVDQWIVLSKFPTAVFAAFSIAGIAVGLTNLVRQPVLNAFMPAISSMLGHGEKVAARALIGHSFTAVGLALAPFLGFLIVLAPDLVSIVYTAEYAAATPIMQLYLIGQLATIFGGGHLLLVLGQGRSAVAISALSLAVAAASGYAGALLLGPIGAALGSISSLWVGEALALWRAASVLSVTMRGLVSARSGLRVLAVACGAVMLALLMLERIPLAGGTVQHLLAAALVYVVVVLVLGMALRLDLTIRALRRADWELRGGAA